MLLDIVLRGQSNAAYLAELDGGAALGTLAGQVEGLLGLDGVNDRVQVIYDRDEQGGETVYPATAFLGEWVEKGAQGWASAEYQQGFLQEMQDYRASGMGDATALLWMHSEYDSRDPNLSAADWAKAVRGDAGLVQATLGREVPYLFVAAHPFGDGTDTGHQAIRAAMEALSVDPSFNARIAARAPDIDASLDDTDGNWSTTDYGGGHIAPIDAQLIANRAARVVAEQWAGYAKPGSVVASQQGDIASDGPQVVMATRIAADAVQVDVRHDGTSGFAPISEGAAGGLGWSLHNADGQVLAATDTAVLDADSLLVRFDSAVPEGAVLHYAYGIGRVAEPNGPGLGNAVMDPTWLPVWTPAQGVAVQDVVWGA